MMSERTPWLELAVVCLGFLLPVIDSNVVVVALPSIAADLRISGAFTTWLFNAYMIGFGGLLVLSGRLADIYGPRRLFVIGVTTFTVASLACGIAQRTSVLLAARAAQGFGGAAIAAVSLSLISTLFPDPVQRTRAMSVYTFVWAAGGALGNLVGGIITRGLSWHWIFLVNIPIGVTVVALALGLLPGDGSLKRTARVDVAGAILVIAVSTTAVYAAIHAQEAGWASLSTIGLFGLVGALLFLLLTIERGMAEPILPLTLFRFRGVRVACPLAVVLAVGSSIWSVMTPLYLHRILGYGPVMVGLSFVPASVVMAVFSAGVATLMVRHFGIERPLSLGLLTLGVGLAMFAGVPSTGVFAVNVFPAMVLMGLGMGVTSTPLLMAAIRNVEPHDSGLVSGLFYTAFMVGGAIGLAVVASLAQGYTEHVSFNVDPIAAMRAGYQLAFLAGALPMVIGAVLVALVLRPPSCTVPTPKEPTPSGNESTRSSGGEVCGN
jgi:EmrB/QacA subfamily drug resistance transporter